MTEIFQEESTSSTLLRQTMEGNRIAQEQIFKIYYPLVYQWCRSAGLGHDDTMDNVQQVFLKLFGSLASYDPDRGRFRSWLWQIARNIAIDHFRKQQRDEELLRTLATPSFPENPPESATGRLLPKIVARKALEVLMERYDGRTREVAIEILVKGRPASAVAEQFGLSLGAVYTNRSRALKLLKESLGELECFKRSDQDPGGELDSE